VSSKFELVVAEAQGWNLVCLPVPGFGMLVSKPNLDLDK